MQSLIIVSFLIAARGMRSGPGPISISGEDIAAG